MFYQEDVAQGLVLGLKALAVALRDPAALACGVEVLNEIRHNPRSQGLKSLVPPILLRVESSLTMHDPPHIARAVRTKAKGCWVRFALRFGFRGEDFFDRPHRPDQFMPRGGREATQNAACLPVRAGIEIAKCGAALFGQREMYQAAILERGRTLHQAAFLKFAEDAAQISGIHA